MLSAAIWFDQLKQFSCGKYQSVCSLLTDGTQSQLLSLLSVFLIIIHSCYHCCFYYFYHSHVLLFLLLHDVHSEIVLQDLWEHRPGQEHPSVCEGTDVENIRQDEVEGTPLFLLFSHCPGWLHK